MTPWIKKEDYSTLEFSALMANKTAGTTVHHPDQITLVEFAERGVVARVPRLSCSIGHSVVLYLYPKGRIQRISERQVQYGQVRDALTASAKVSEVDPISTDYSAVEFNFVQLDEVEWKSMIHQFAERQDRIDFVVHSIKK